MLDRQVVKEFLEEELKGVEIPKDGELDWSWIRKRLRLTDPQKLIGDGINN